MIRYNGMTRCLLNNDGCRHEKMTFYAVGHTHTQAEHVGLQTILGCSPCSGVSENRHNFMTQPVVARGVCAVKPCISGVLEFAVFGMVYAFHIIKEIWR